MTASSENVTILNQDNIHLMKLVEDLETAIETYSTRCNLSEIVGALEIVKQNTIQLSLYGE